VLGLLGHELLAQTGSKDTTGDFVRDSKLGWRGLRTRQRDLRRFIDGSRHCGGGEGGMQVTSMMAKHSGDGTPADTARRETGGRGRVEEEGRGREDAPSLLGGRLP